MIPWYDDKEVLSIGFTSSPDVDVRVIKPSMSDEEIEDIKNKPFINKKAFFVVLFDHKKHKTYKFEVQKNYTWDGASIPKLFWRIIGSNTDPQFLIASLIHDILCENKEFVNYDRYFADKVFERLLYVARVPKFKRWLMFHCVDNFQKFKHWENIEASLLEEEGGEDEGNA